MLNAQTIKLHAHALGFDKVGIVAATALTDEGQRLQAWLDAGYHGALWYMARDPQQRADPRLLLPSTRSVVCVALNYHQPDKHSDDPAIGKISRYAWGDDYHDVLRDKLKALLALIQQSAPDIEGKICVDSTPAMDKAWAVRAGIGWLGKHTNVITKEFGSWVFLGELLLSCELEYDTRIEPDHCGKCTACLDACPTGALIEPYQIDGTRCISYGTIELREPELPEPINSNLQNWIFGCDICQDVCPWTRFAKTTKEDRFTPRAGITAPPLQALTELTQEEFSTRFRRNPVKRAKLAGLQRNARAALQANEKDGSLDGETERRGDGETGRRRDGETERRYSS